MEENFNSPKNEDLIWWENTLAGADDKSGFSSLDFSLVVEPLDFPMAFSVSARDDAFSVSVSFSFDMKDKSVFELTEFFDEFGNAFLESLAAAGTLTFFSV